MIYSELYREGVDCLTHADISEAALDARLLLEYICKTDRNTLLAHPDKEVSQTEEVLYRNLIDKRSKHIPSQYLTGSQEFMGLTFKVTKDVLIPRPDTECLVEEVLKNMHDGMDILDMCTGSGCILISLLYYSNGCKGLGVDISKEALAIAKENAKQILADKANISCEFTESDMFDAVEGKYDIIVSNPPYIKTSDIAALEPEVREFDPLSALDGGDDGLLFYRILAEKGNEYLKPFGLMAFEIGFDQSKEVEEILGSKGYRDIITIKDYAGNDRVVTARKGL